MLKLKITEREIDQSWTIAEIGKEFPPRTWEKVFSDAENEIKDVSDILEEQGEFFPQKEDIFAALWYTSLEEVKVVILGQDPYHQMVNIHDVSVPRACGLSFSVREGDSIPSSLKNIYKELTNSVRGFREPNHGSLVEWAVQGVLLLNKCFTVAPSKPGSHGDIWLGLVNRLFRAISSKNPKCIYILWGKEAQKVKSMIGEKSFVLEAAHPSGLSASRGFFGCNHFVTANEELLKQGKKPINWSLTNR